MVEMSNITLGLLSASLAIFRPFPISPGFPIEQVAALAQRLPSHSWEYGTAAEALLELYNPALSVFGPTPFPVPTAGASDVRSLSYAADNIDLGNGKRLGEGSGAVGDPASLGVAAVMLGKTDSRYADAAKATVDYLINGAPRFSNDAISQRANVAELWADFMYMAPPFLAYYAADQDDESLLQETVRQCGLYRQVLRSGKGPWMHIVGPQSQDKGLWSTGNGWAAAGMTRVLATVMKAPVARNKPWQAGAVSDLLSWILEILDGAIATSTDEGLLRNYYDSADPNGLGFGETSGSALLAAVAYRVSLLQPQIGDKYVSWADGIRDVLAGTDSDGNLHVTDGGVVTPAVNPLAWKDTAPWTSGSPEGQSFVVLMYAAWRDCVQAGRCQQPVGHQRMRKRRRRSSH